MRINDLLDTSQGTMMALINVCILICHATYLLVLVSLTCTMQSTQLLMSVRRRTKSYNTYRAKVLIGFIFNRAGRLSGCQVNLNV